MAALSIQAGAILAGGCAGHAGKEAAEVGGFVKPQLMRDGGDLQAGIGEVAASFAGDGLVDQGLDGAARL